MQPVFAYTHRQWIAHLKERAGMDPQRALRFYRSAMKQGPLALEAVAAPSESGLAHHTRQTIEAYTPKVVETSSDGEVRKSVLRLTDGHLIESVLVPMATHATLCVSTQVGCRMGCTFCETGRQPWIRNLTPAEMVGQVYLAKTLRSHNVRNVVFMGMGEPLDNFSNLTQAVAILHDQHGLDIALRYVTVSTVGLLPALERLSRLSRPRFNLAISLNAPNDILRSQLMPINRTHNMTDLRNFMAAYSQSPKEFILVGYILIKDLNDSPAHAQELAAYLRGLPIKLNLIPYNPQRKAAYKAPTEKELQRFRDWMVDQRIFVRRRTPKGAGVMAGCGQLGNRPDTP
jgi:23S rRNA (adenine2503-C2)-methyltransferase